MRWGMPHALWPEGGYFEMLAKLVAANSSGDCSTVLWVSLSDIARCEPPSLREAGGSL